MEVLQNYYWWHLNSLKNVDFIFEEAIKDLNLFLKSTIWKKKKIIFL
jgi:hypothetical protein